MTKLDNIRKAMDGEVDALLILDEINQYYFTGFKFSDGAVLITKEKAYLITDFRYYEEANNAVSDRFEVVMPKRHYDFIKEALLGEECAIVGIEEDFVSLSRYRALEKSFDSFKLKNISAIISSQRQVKSEKEIENIRFAQSITDMAYKHILSVITLNMTEIDVALELEFYMRKHGAEAMAFDVIAVSGDASALPHGKPRNVKLKSGFLTMDFGAMYNGYCSDMTRTVSIGKATDDMKKLYNTVLEAQRLALLEIRAGAECSAIDAVARAYIDNAGYGGAFGHSLGHGVGMFIHEQPSLSHRATDKLLEVGNVVTVEPGIYLNGKYGCRIEDMVAVTASGCENLTKSSKDLIEIY